MNRWLGFAGAALTLMIGSSAWAGTTSTQIADATPATEHGWTGPYLGIEGGYGWGQSHHSVPGFPSFDNKFAVPGALVGGTAGYNLQVAPFVFGAEADMSKSWQSGSTAGIPPVSCPPGGPTANCTTRLDWLGTLRLRAGYLVWHRFMPFVSGGFAAGEVHGSTDNGGNGGSATRFGWTAGTGVEAKIFAGWPAKIEYLHVDLGTAGTIFVRQPGAFPFNVSFSSDDVRAGLNYHF